VSQVFSVAIGSGCAIFVTFCKIALQIRLRYETSVAANLDINATIVFKTDIFQMVEAVKEMRMNRTDLVINKINENQVGVVFKKSI
jgi:hypothetical protein